MTEAQKILEMIEAADPADTAMMDEIDARAWCWLKGIEYFGYGFQTGDLGEPEMYLLDHNHKYPMRVTTSRDALKSIRPEGWIICYMNQDWYVDGSYTYTRIGMKKLMSRGIGVQSKALETEELAELHAIIQAIEYERTTK